LRSSDSLGFSRLLCACPNMLQQHLIPVAGGVHEWPAQGPVCVCPICIHVLLLRIRPTTTSAAASQGATVGCVLYICIPRHAEAVQLEFDPKQTSYSKLLDVFWKKHDPTTLNQQGNDRGTQYRSGVYYHSEEQKKLATERSTCVPPSRSELTRWLVHVRAARMQSPRSWARRS